MHIIPLFADEGAVVYAGEYSKVKRYTKNILLEKINFY